MASQDYAVSGELSLRSWLRRIDESGGLDCYLHVIGQHYSSPSQVAASYTVAGERGLVFDSQFFEDMGIDDLKHKRMFQRWFEAEDAPHRGDMGRAAHGIGRSMRTAPSNIGDGSGLRRTWRPPARADPPGDVFSAGGVSDLGETYASRWAQADRSEDERTAESGLDSDSTRQSIHHWGSTIGQSWWDKGAWSSSEYGSWRGDEWPRSGSGTGHWRSRWDDKSFGGGWDDRTVTELSRAPSAPASDQDCAPSRTSQVKATASSATVGGATDAAAPQVAPQRLVKNLRTGTPGRERFGTPGRDRNGTPGRERTGTPGKERTGTPGRERTGTPGKERNVTPGRERNRGGGSGRRAGDAAAIRTARLGSHGSGVVGHAAPVAAAVPQNNGKRSTNGVHRPTGALAEWLLSLGAGSSLLRYHTPLEDFFETPEQVFLAYTTPISFESPQRFDKGFYTEVGISDEAHQKLFEQWFSSRLVSSCAPAKGVAQAHVEQPLAPSVAKGAGARAAANAPEVKVLQKAGNNNQKTVLADCSGSPVVNGVVKISQLGTNLSDEGGATPAKAMTGSESDGEHCNQLATAKSASNCAAPEAERTSPKPSRWSSFADTKEQQLEVKSPVRTGAAVADDSVNGSSTSAATVRAKSTPPILLSATSTASAPAVSTCSVHSSAEASGGSGAAVSANVGPSAELAGKLRQIREAATVLPDPDPRQHAAVVLLGHAGVGKTTLLGGLMEVTGAWDTRQVDKYFKERRQPSKLGSASNDAAAAAEGIQIERCQTENRRYTLLDPPGQRRCVQQAWAAAAQADLAVLVVSANSGELEASLAKGGQTREHAVLAKSAGVESLIVAVNKMDPEDKAGRWSNLRYEEVRAELWAALKTVGFKDDELTFVPISAVTRENLASREGDSEDEEQNTCPPSAGWYSGGSFLEVLDGTPLPAREAHAPVRVLVLGREKGKGIATPVVSGRIEQGTVEAGAAAMVMPMGTECGIQAVEINGKEVRRALAGELVQLRLLGGQPNLGQALCSLEEPLRAASKFKAQIRFLEISDDTPIITPGFRCLLHLHGATEECEVAKLIEAVDPRTKKKEAPPKFVRAPMVALCVLTLSSGHEVPVEAGSGRFARFSLRTDGGTIGVGKVAELPKVK